MIESHQEFLEKQRPFLFLLGDSRKILKYGELLRDVFQDKVIVNGFQQKLKDAIKDKAKVAIIFNDTDKSKIVYLEVDFNEVVHVDGIVDELRKYYEN